ncbi:MAG: hypothetical protein CR982_02600 [Candidatus Cloacimonadota bacterium]|nr:MAG: hypothetical protein CR982_02600 [Candidatus Cloacimonadota bacterium]PIE79320.1 MAG: hypothetical protein CSA15_03455 [Candidatus Delongbacteria bacterium]
MTKDLEKISSTKIWPWVVITFGCMLSAFGYTVFVTPMHFYEGGVIGIAYLMNYIFDLPLGITNMAITFVIFLVGTKLLGKGFGVRSIYAVTIFGFLLDGFQYLHDTYFPYVLSDDKLINSFYGGILIGIGMGLVFFHGACTGGSDAFAQIMRWIKRIPIGKTLITVDMIVLSLATIWAYKTDSIAGLETIMYTFIFIFIQIKTVDVVLNGFNASQRIIITTDKPDELKEAIFKSLHRGITTFQGTGGYTGVNRPVLTTVLPKKHMQEVVNIVSEIDDRAFMVIHDVSQVYGFGFEELPKEGQKPEMKAIQDTRPKG